MQQLNKEQAIAIAESGIWKNWNDKEKVKFQLFQDRLCMDFSVFHKAIEKILERPVFTHEFATKGQLIQEYLGKKQAPTFEEIIELIPEEKRMIVYLFILKEERKMKMKRKRRNKVVSESIKNGIKVWKEKMKEKKEKVEN